MELPVIIERCENFRREQTIPRVSTKRSFQVYGEIQFCKVKGTDMGCGGYSDACPIPEKFSPRKRTPK